VSEYVHLNPARAKLVNAEQALRTYRWSSWPEYLKRPQERPGWLRVDRVLGELGIPKDSPAGRRELERRMELRRNAEDGVEYPEIRQGGSMANRT
jgi:putative transposase